MCRYINHIILSLSQSKLYIKPIKCHYRVEIFVQNFQIIRQSLLLSMSIDSMNHRWYEFVKVK